MADVFTLDSAYLAAKREKIKSEIARARYKVGSTWHDAQINSATVLPNGRIEVTFEIDHTVVGDITVTAIELYDQNGVRVGGKSVSITRADATEGILYVCRFSLFQVVENTENTGAYDAL